MMNMSIMLAIMKTLQYFSLWIAASSTYWLTCQGTVLQRSQLHNLDNNTPFYVMILIVRIGLFQNIFTFTDM